MANYFPISRLGRAAATGNLKTIAEFISNDADLNQFEGKDQLTPLMRAAKYGQAKSVKMLAVYADADRANSDRETALFIAAMEGHLDCVELLLESINRDEYWKCDLRCWIRQQQFASRHRHGNTRNLS